MLKNMNNLPDNVLGITAEGKITGKDYETLLIPALEEKLKVNKKIRMIYHFNISYSSLLQFHFSFS